MTTNARSRCLSYKWTIGLSSATQSARCMVMYAPLRTPDWLFFVALARIRARGRRFQRSRGLRRRGSLYNGTKRTSTCGYPCKPVESNSFPCIGWPLSLLMRASTECRLAICNRFISQKLHPLQLVDSGKIPEQSSPGRRRVVLILKLTVHWTL